MRSLLAVLTVIALAIGLSAGFVHVLGDRETLVSPPEAVAEGFVKELGERRFEQAVPYLTEDLAKRTQKDDLERRTTAFFTRAGEMEDVVGESGKTDEQTATAVAVVKTGKAGEKMLKFVLAFQDGAWKIAALPGELGG